MNRIRIAILFFLAPTLVSAQQQMFRYIDRDGHVVYTDITPPADARSVQQKRLGGNFIETSEAPYALQIAQQRNAVTLFSGPCGPLCDQARALLNRRGVPFRDIDPSQPGELEKLKQYSGDQQVPVLVVGSATVLKGMEEGKWQAALDQAGYPKTPMARITAIKRDADKAAADKAAADKAAMQRATGKLADKGDTTAAAKSDAPGQVKTDAAVEARK